jgi:acyl-CoA synthetase (AMP-forming)/AMP-acid ligase II
MAVKHHYAMMSFVRSSRPSHFPDHKVKGLGPNDRVMLALPTGPENAVALLALASYYTCVPVDLPKNSLYVVL